MWEAIASNRRRSLWLIGLMGALLVLLGAVFGLTIAAYAGVAHQPTLPGAPAPTLGAQLLDAHMGAWVGIAVALLIWLIMLGTAAGSGDAILLRTAGAHEIKKEDAPQLWNVVEEMTIASGLGRMPRVFIIDDAGLNAFAVGSRPDRASVAVTSGLLKRLTRDELQGVVAHEIGHIQNLDVRFMTLAGIMLGAIVLMSHGFLRGMYYSSGGRRRSSSRGGGGQLAIIMLVIAILLAILAPIAAQLLYFSCSRRREFLADACSARFTRYPAGLASALEKISINAGSGATASKVIAPMCIVNPLQARAAAGLLSTHPPTAERIKVLRSMAGADYTAYEEAYRRVHGSNEHCVDSRTLESAEQIAIREATPEPTAKASAVERAQAVGQLLDRVLPLVVIPCPCGVRLKLPPDFKRDTLACPRCGRQHTVPHAAGTTKSGESNRVPDRPGQQSMRYERRGTGWESFRCACGHTVQLSPRFSANETVCSKCHQRIAIIPGPDA